MKQYYKGYELRQGVAVFAHKLCSNLGRPPVTVVWSSSVQTAGISTSGTMYLADIADDVTVHRSVFEKYCGFVAHELCHHVYSGNVFGSTQYLNSLRNAIEDAWIEHKAIQSGMTGNIDTLFTNLIEMMTEQAMTDVTDWTNPQVYPYALAVYLRNHAKTKTPLAIGLEPIFAEAGKRLVNSTKSEDNLDIAKWVLEQLQLLGDEKGEEGEEGKPEDGEGEDGAEGEKPSDSEEGSGSPLDGSESDEEEGGKGKPTSDKEKGAEGVSIGKAKAPKNLDEAMEVEPQIGDPNTSGGRGTYCVEWNFKNEDHHIGSHAKFDVSSNVPAKLRYTVRRLFDNSGIEEFQRNRKAGSVNVHALPNVAFSDNLFKRRFEIDGIDSAVVIVLDVSASMFDDEPQMGRIRTAIQTTVALVDTLTKAGVATSVLTFGDEASLVKTWNTPLPKMITKIKSLQNGGGTNDAFAVRYAHEMLLKRSEERKITFVITDGIGRVSVTRQQVESGSRLGITTIGVGIGMDVSRIYKQSVTVRNTEDLANASFNQIKLVA